MPGTEPLSDSHLRPRLRPIDVQPVLYEGMTYFHLRDPLGLSGRTLLVPQPLASLLPLMDGSRDLAGLQLAFAVRERTRISVDEIRRLVQALDDALLIENENYRAGREKALAEYLSNGCRTASSAGKSYPQEPDALHNLLQGYINDLPADLQTSQRPVRGLISPHIDFERGGPTYARAWCRSVTGLRKAELVIILGTDHYSEGIPFTLTRQDFCTPYGRLQVDLDSVYELCSVMGTEEAFRGELHHRSEHSIELPAVWLQHMLGESTPPILPILCGPLDSFETSTGNPADHPALRRLIERLKKICIDRKAFIIAAGDLAHVGPAFGGPPISPVDLMRLKEADDALIGAISTADAHKFYRLIQQTGDANNVCGTSPIYMALMLLEGCSGVDQAYAVCPADVDNTSYVSICGIPLA